MGWCSSLPIFIKKENDKERNYYDITITQDSLSRPYEETIGTLVHEIAHMYLSTQGIEHCTKRQKHLEAFKVESERLGLIVEDAGKTGQSQTTVSETLLDEIHNKMGLDVSAFDIHLIDDYKEKKPSKPRKPVHKYKCNCGKEIKATDDNLICTCGDCESEFVLQVK